MWKRIPRQRGGAVALALAVAAALLGCSGESSPGGGAAAGSAAGAPVRFSPNTAAGTALTRLAALLPPVLAAPACATYAGTVTAFVDGLRGELAPLAAHGDDGAPASAVLHLADWLDARATALAAVTPPEVAAARHRELGAAAADLAASLRELLRPVAEQATPAGPRLLNAVENLEATDRGLVEACESSGP